MPLIPVQVAGISIFPPFQGYGVILREMGDGRWFPIFIGAVEAQTITLLQRKVKHERPMTFDLVQSMMESAGVNVMQVTITALKNNTFYSVIKMERNGESYSVDARPSDSIALALQLDVPIFVASEVIEEAGFVGEIGETPAETTSGSSSTKSLRQQVEELQQRMDQMIQLEKFEEAALIRDQIKSLTQTS